MPQETLFFNTTSEGNTLHFMQLKENKITRSDLIHTIEKEKKKYLFICTTNSQEKCSTVWGEMVHIKDIGIEFLTSETSSLIEENAKKLNAYLATKSHIKHIVIEEAEELLCLLEEDKQSSIRLHTNILVNILRNIITARQQDLTILTQSPLLSRSIDSIDNLPHNMKISRNITIMKSNNIALTPTTDGLSIFQKITTKPCDTGVARLNAILQKNKGEYGDMIFFSSNDGSRFVRFALDTALASAPLENEICLIAPFRLKQEIYASLKLINDKIKKLTHKALKRSTIVSSEDLASTKLDTEDALMQTIRHTILQFKKRLNEKHHTEGICLIDITNIDTFGGEIDYPSLRWYAKANNILIIIGADEAEERYTFKRREKIEKINQTFQKKPSALPNNFSK